MMLMLLDAQWPAAWRSPSPGEPVGQPFLPWACVSLGRWEAPRAEVPGPHALVKDLRLKGWLIPIEAELPQRKEV